MSVLGLTWWASSGRVVWKQDGLSGTGGTLLRVRVTLRAAGPQTVFWAITALQPPSPVAVPPLQNQRALNMCVFLSPPRVFLLVHAETSSSDQRQACKKHELYVSFRDLGWQVSMAGLPHTGAFSVPASHKAVSMGAVGHSLCLFPPQGQGPICPRLASHSLCSLG